jgi:hypothetical protein
MTVSGSIGDNDRQRVYDSRVVPRVKLLVDISNAFGGYFSVDTLKKIWEDYDEGFVELECGLILDWSMYVPANEASTDRIRESRQRKNPSRRSGDR